MGKKIWSLDKFQNMLSVLLEGETGSSYSSRSTSTRGHYSNSREPNLLQLLHHERLNGPSDRDPTAVHRELCYFKGPHIYIWDMDEKHKPIMVREYPKVANKADGEWPQFRSVGNGRCPFVEDHDVPDKDHRRQQEKARAVKREESVPILRPPQIPVPKPVTGKRTLTEMEDAQNRARAVTPTELFNPKAIMSKPADIRQNAFTGRAGTGRLFAGEPVASGVQPSNITSAIRSQMVSSTSGVNGAKAGTSKEVHGLQRKVLQKAAPASHDVSSRRLAEVSMDVASSRSTTMGRHTSRPADVQEEEQKTERKTQQSLKSKRDLKPGYCENCQDKFRDFDEVSLTTISRPTHANLTSTFYLASTASLPKTTTTGLSLILSCHNSSECPSFLQDPTRKRDGNTASTLIRPTLNFSHPYHGLSGPRMHPTILMTSIFSSKQIPSQYKAKQSKTKIKQTTATKIPRGLVISA